MNTTNPKRRSRPPFALSSYTACVVALGMWTACDSGCPENYVLQGEDCRYLKNLQKDSGADDDSGPSATRSNPTTGTGTTGSPSSKQPAIDSATQWMCMKNPSGECSSCRLDSDCLTRVCEQGFCMDCRDSSQCSADESCISLRCVPSRRPTNIWSSSGGGLMSSPGFRLQVSMGTTSSTSSVTAAGFKLQISPSAGLY